ncbi:MAG: nitroreductase/quinone reductase family protein [Anaerolineae bacterium]|nr:nitroreductase/quinone reductase family protein [Anaerolineae bacterium]
MQNLMNKFINPILNQLLRSPLHGLVSRNLMLITFTGRKSHHIYTTPVEYRRVGDTIMVLSRKGRAWWKNLQGGAPVTVSVHGQELQGQAEVVPVDEQVIKQVFHQMHPSIAESKLDEYAPDMVLIQIRV